MKNEKVTQLNAYSNNNTLQTIRIAKRKKAVRRRVTVILIGGLFLIGLAGLPVLQNIRAAKEYDAEAVQLAAKLEDTEREEKELEYQVSLLEDEEYIAKLARQELNLSKENEVLINIPELEEDNDADEVD